MSAEKVFSASLRQSPVPQKEFVGPWQIDVLAGFDPQSDGGQPILLRIFHRASGLALAGQIASYQPEIIVDEVMANDLFLPSPMARRVLAKLSTKYAPQMRRPGVGVLCNLQEIVSRADVGNPLDFGRLVGITDRLELEELISQDYEEREGRTVRDMVRRSINTFC